MDPTADSCSRRKIVLSRERDDLVPSGKGIVRHQLEFFYDVPFILTLFKAISDVTGHLRSRRLKKRIWEGEVSLSPPSPATTPLFSWHGRRGKWGKRVGWEKEFFDLPRRDRIGKIRKRNWWLVSSSHNGSWWKPQRSTAHRKSWIWIRIFEDIKEQS